MVKSVFAIEFLCGGLQRFFYIKVKSSSLSPLFFFPVFLFFCVVAGPEDMVCMWRTICSSCFSDAFCFEKYLWCFSGCETFRCYRTRDNRDLTHLPCTKLGVSATFFVLISFCVDPAFFFSKKLGGTKFCCFEIVVANNGQNTVFSFRGCQCCSKFDFIHDVLLLFAFFIFGVLRASDPFELSFMASPILSNRFL